VLLVTVYTAGGILLQPLVGWAADRTSHVRLLRAAALSFVISLAVLPLVIGTLALAWPVLFLAGGAVASFYTLGLILLGERFQAEGLAEANTLFIICYTGGSVVGPVLAGAGMELWRPDGFLLVLALAAAAFLLTSVPMAGRAARS
jgi:MFS family permease